MAYEEVAFASTLERFQLSCDEDRACYQVD